MVPPSRLHGLHVFLSVLTGSPVPAGRSGSSHAWAIAGLLSAFWQSAREGMRPPELSASRDGGCGGRVGGLLREKPTLISTGAVPVRAPTGRERSCSVSLSTRGVASRLSFCWCSAVCGGTLRGSDVQFPDG